MPAVGDKLAAGFGLDDRTWLRHANPWSVWTRATVLPFLMLALWSRVWLGWWCLLPVALCLFWMWLNPRAFPPPRSTRNWASKSVLGERVWLNRRRRPVPPHHRLLPPLLAALAAVGTLLAIWGVIALALWPALTGLSVVYTAKFWFLDRMVWLYEDMRDADPTYAAWLY
jgi:hypothetical protein